MRQTNNREESGYLRETLVLYTIGNLLVTRLLSGRTRFYQTMILAVFLYGYEAWSGKVKFRIFENKILRT